SFIDRVARGRTDGSELSAAVHFSKEFHMKRLSVTPQLGLQYTRIHVNGLNETNAGALNLAVNGYGAESLRGTLGVHVGYNVEISDRATLTPYLTLSWQHEFNSPEQTVRAALPAEGGGEFRYDGGSLGGDRMQAGAGLMLQLDNNISVNLGYQAEFGSNDYESHMIMLMVSYRF
ncbi:MAG: outer rane autotransporter barrel domain protein, partial [Verrucomicrobiaceae bacterium]|nr:outer rane autotransporter barrel domain protein [Verrucomicrobiaceae bacterium]